jgi:oligopeptide transport system permease protein
VSIGLRPPASVLAPDPPAAGARPPRSLWSDAWARLKRNRVAVAAGAFLIVMSVFATLAPWLPGLPDPAGQDLAKGASPPSLAHVFGTDELGRDLLARVLHGGRISLLVGLVGTLVSLLIGVTWGAVAGYVGGRTDDLMMRVVDVLYALPYLFLVILLLVFFSRSLVMLFVALGLVQWLTMARIVRGQVLSLKQQNFVEAARALGATDARIVFAHLVPNTLGPVIVYTTLTIPAIILQEAFLSFLGLGVQPPDASWGVLVAEGAQMLAFFPWLTLFPGAALALTLFAFNFLGDGLRDALDPQDRRTSA